MKESGGVHKCESLNSDYRNRKGADKLDRVICRTDPIALDEQNKYLRKDGCVGAITTDGSSPKHNNRILTGGVIRVKTANRKGYMEAKEGDGIDISARMEYHRGTVQNQMSHAITTGGGAYEGVVILDKSADEPL